MRIVTKVGIALSSLVIITSFAKASPPNEIPQHTKWMRNSLKGHATGLGRKAEYAPLDPQPGGSEKGGDGGGLPGAPGGKGGATGVVEDEKTSTKKPAQEQSIASQRLRNYCIDVLNNPSKATGSGFHLRDCATYILQLEENNSSQQQYDAVNGRGMSGSDGPSIGGGVGGQGGAAGIGPNSGSGGSGGAGINGGQGGAGGAGGSGF